MSMLSVCVCYMYSIHSAHQYQALLKLTGGDIFLSLLLLTVTAVIFSCTYAQVRWNSKIFSITRAVVVFIYIYIGWFISR